MRVLVAASVVLFTTTALATTPAQIDERWKDLEIDKLHASASGAIKSACGSTAKIEIDKKSLTNASSWGVVEMVKAELISIEEIVKGFCTSPDSKKQFAAIKGFRIVGVPSEKAPTFAAGWMTLEVDSMGYQMRSRLQDAIQEAVAPKK
jgi:hypothetical protein